MTLALHGASVLTLCEEELMNDPALRNTWANLFTDYDSSKVRLEEESLTTIKIELYCDIVKRFLHVVTNQFTKDVLHELEEKNLKENCSQSKRSESKIEHEDSRQGKCS